MTTDRPDQPDQRADDVLLERKDLPAPFPALVAYFTVRARRHNDQYHADVEASVQRYLYSGFRTQGDARYDPSDSNNVLVTVCFTGYHSSDGVNRMRLQEQADRIRSSGYMSCSEPVLYRPLKTA